MSFPDLLLAIESFPDPTPEVAIDEAVSLAARLHGRLSALAVEASFPVRRNAMADYLIGLTATARDQEAASRDLCDQRLAAFERKAGEAGVFTASTREVCPYFEIADRLAHRARTYDLCLLPLSGGFGAPRETAQSVVFGAGRPVLIYRAGEMGRLATGGGQAVVAWDGSRGAARAMADAMPILSRSTLVRVLVVLNDKPTADDAIGEEALRHLRAHGLAAELDVVDGAGRPIGAVLDSHIREHSPELLVMGAYGHSRMREFLLGGATEHVLADPPCPVLLSH